MTPKPSEILRPLLDAHGNVKGDSDSYRDKLFSILDRHDAELRRIAAKVDGPQTASEPLPVAKPDASDGLEAEAMEWAEKCLKWNRHQECTWVHNDHAESDYRGQIIRDRDDLPSARDVFASILTAFASRAIERETKKYREMNEALRDQSTFQGGQLLAARAECEQLRGLIREFTEKMTKTLGDGLPKGAVR